MNAPVGKFYKGYWIRLDYEIENENVWKVQRGDGTVVGWAGGITVAKQMADLDLKG